MHGIDDVCLLGLLAYVERLEYFNICSSCDAD